MRLRHCVVYAMRVCALLQNDQQTDLLVVKVPSAGSPRVLPDIGDTTTVYDFPGNRLSNVVEVSAANLCVFATSLSFT